MIHTHSIGMPPSPKDVGHILLNDIENTDAATAIFVATPVINYLVFRGAQTPNLSQSEVSKLEKVWDDRIEVAWDSRVEEEWIRKIKEKPGLKLGEISEKERFTRFFGEQYTDREFTGLSAVLQQEVLNDFVNEYDLTAFTGLAQDQIIKRVTG
jgi:hypothetical protein